MYLGLPLSSKALPKQYYQRVVDTIQDRLPGFHTSKLSIAGRIVILNSVISAMPVYFMLVFLLSECVIKAIDRIRRNFFWHGHKDNQASKRGICLVNWRIVTTNKLYGGLGIRDIKLMNYALITKWMWLWMKSDKWWKEGTQALDEAYTLWEDRNASRFWKNIAKIKEAFICSILYKVGNGKCIIF
jgi:hypothetical protein